MVLFKEYNEKNKKERAWYDSSNCFYSEMIEDEFENKGNLYITFSNGAVYLYKDVLLSDYVLFVGGGTTSSQGKTLNSVIKPKYECEKVSGPDNTLHENLQNELNKLLEEEKRKKEDVSNTFFISGHRNITEEEFEINYQQALIDVIDSFEMARFVVGDCVGVDIMAQNFLLDVLKIDPQRLIVFHIGDKPENVNPKVERTIGGFETDEERDSAMTKNSSFDIAFVRNHTELTGTAMNILRRNRFFN